MNDLLSLRQEDASPTERSADHRRAGPREIAAVVLCATVIVGALWLPVLHSAPGGRSADLRAGDLPVLKFGCWIVVGGIVLTMATSAATRRPQFEALAGMLACALLIAGIGLLIAVETASALIPRGLLPVTVRRATFDLRAGSGLWLFVVAAGCMVVATVPQLRSQAARLRGELRRWPWQRLTALGVLAAAVVVAATARYQGWIVGSVAAQDVRVEAWATPWIGLLSLVAVWCLVAAVVLGATSRDAQAAVFAAFGGWLTTFCAGLVILAAKPLGELRFDSIAPENLRAYTPAFHVTSAAWFAYATGWVAALSAVGLLLVSRESTRNETA